MPNISLFATTSAIAILLSSSGVALAQESADGASGQMSEIVVTAQRRAQSIQDVGISMSAFSGEQLEQMGVRSSTDIARLTPGVSLSSTAGGQNSSFSIRGVIQNDFNDTIEGPVATYVDETYVPNLNGQIFGTFDLERVEVLKGPQGTLFGRNATGGLVHFIPRKPSDKPEGYVDLTYGRYNRVRAEAAIGLPLGEKVAIRLSGLYNRFDPIMKNKYPQGSALAVGGTPPSPCCSDLWNDDSYALRGQIQLKPTDRFTVRVSGSVSHTEASTTPYNQIATVPVFDNQGRLINVVTAAANETRIGIGPNGINVGLNGQPTTNVRPVAGGDVFGFVPLPNKFNISQDFARKDLNTLKAYDAALHLDYDLDTVKIVAISDYRRFNKYTTTDVDASPTNLVDYANKSQQESFSQEVRVSGGGNGVEWVAGAYFLHTKTHVNNGFLAPRNSVFAGLFPGFAQSGIDLVNDFTLRGTSISAFGQVEYKFAPKFTFILGGRIIRERQDYDFSSSAFANVDDYRIDTGTELFPLQPDYANKRSKTLWAGKAQLEYRPNRDLLVYVGVNRGVKGGAYNSLLPDGASVLAPNQVPYKPETLYSYEAGFKATLSRTFTIDGSVYYYDYKNYQAFTFQNVSGIVSNNNARTIGAELSVNARPVDGLVIGAGISVLDAKVKDLALAPGLVRDVKPSFTPSTQLAGQIAYTLPADISGGRVTLGVDGSWRSRAYANIRNFDADVIRQYFLANARINWKADDGHLTIGAGVDNVFDKRYETVNFNLATLCGCNEVSYGTPRWWNLNVKVAY